MPFTGNTVAKSPCGGLSQGLPWHWLGLSGDRGPPNGTFCDPLSFPSSACPSLNETAVTLLICLCRYHICEGTPRIWDQCDTNKLLISLGASLLGLAGPCLEPGVAETVCVGMV